MVKAEVGDDVFGEDPAVNAFQDKMAKLFTFEAGLFVPSGVMSNQVALNLLTEPGDEVIIEEDSHVFNYETTSTALISSVQLHPVKGERGKLKPEHIQKAIRPNVDWMPKTSAVVIENSTNKGGGACYSRNELAEIREATNEAGLSLHLDGARIWNAMTATDLEPAFFGKIADTMTISFSKGLGAPVGSILLSSKQNINKARRVRKMLGGGMRQIGILAAAADYGVDNHWPLLAEDHRRAKALASTIAKCNRLSIDPKTVETNIVIFDAKGMTAEEAVDRLEEQGIELVRFGPQTLRATFHFQIGDGDLEKTQDVFQSLFG